VKHKFQQKNNKKNKQGHLPPASRAGCLPQEGPANNFGTSRPLDGREVPGPMPPARSTGGKYPFFEFFVSGTSFLNFIFLSFSKKTCRTRRMGPVRGRAAHCELAAHALAGGRPAGCQALQRTQAGAAIPRADGRCSG
jgi:hypothetical protein